MTVTAIPEDIIIFYVQLVAYSRNRKEFQMLVVQKKTYWLQNTYNLYVTEQKPMCDDGRKDTLFTSMSTNLKGHYKHFYGYRPIFNNSKTGFEVGNNLTYAAHYQPCCCCYYRCILLLLLPSSTTA